MTRVHSSILQGIDAIAGEVPAFLPADEAGLAEVGLAAAYEELSVAAHNGRLPCPGTK